MNPSWAMPTRSDHGHSLLEAAKLVEGEVPSRILSIRQVRQYPVDHQIRAAVEQVEKVAQFSERDPKPVHPGVNLQVHPARNAPRTSQSL